MPSLKTLKNRIKSVKSTQKITKAMKMVAASKLKRAREKAEAATPYANKMHSMLISVARNIPESSTAPSLLIGNGKDNIHLLIVITADRGLCGAFNSSIVKLVRKNAEQLLAEGKKIQLLCVGKKGYELLRKSYGSYIVNYINGVGAKGIKYAEAQEIAEQAMDLFFESKVDICHVFYNKFKSVISQIPTKQQLVPIPREDFSVIAASANVYEFEPNEEKILTELLPKNLGVQIYRALLEGYASEQGSRMSAMDNATRNSGEMIKRLNLLYNRTRQAYITKELIEIISGAEAI